MHRTARPLAIGTLAALVAATSLAAASIAAPNSTAAADPGQPTSAPRSLNAASADSDAFWTPKRLASAQPMDIVRDDQRRPDVHKNRPLRRTGHTVAAIDNASGTGGEFTKPAQNQPTMTYPYPYGRRGLEKQLGKVSPYKAVGRVFFQQGGGFWSCSGASVVGGPRHVVFTAGHCLNDGLGVGATHWSINVVFIPGRKSGKFKNPFGRFNAKELWTPLGWSQDGNYAYDLGAFTVGANKKGKKLKKAVGAFGFAYNEGRVQHWDIFGYPAEDPWHGNKVVTCATQHAVDDAVPEGPNTLGVGCDLNGGSSGGPWVHRLRRGNYINGVTSYGYGVEPEAIYSPYFDTTANNLRCAAAKNDESATSC